MAVFLSEMRWSRRPDQVRHQLAGVFEMTDATVPPGVSGFGYKPNSLRLTGLIMPAGICLFGNGWPVKGSLMVWLTPDRSPDRSAAFGTILVVGRCATKFFCGVAVNI